METGKYKQRTIKKNSLENNYIHNRQLKKEKGQERFYFLEDPMVKFETTKTWNLKAGCNMNHTSEE